MFNLISKEKIRKVVIELIGDLTVKYSYFEMSIILDINEIQSTNCVKGYIPKADNLLNLQILYNALTK